MTLRQYLIIMIGATVLSWSAVGIIIVMTDPTQAQALMFAILFFSLFLAFTGSFSIIGFLMRVWILKKQYYISREVLVSFRHAVLLSTLLITALIMQSRMILSWWNALIMVATLTLLESFFVSARPKK